MSIKDLDEVFGISRPIPLSYINRAGIDDLFLESLKKQKHIVIYGSSKQGKTSLRKKHLKESEYIVVTCSDKQEIGDLNQTILKQAGFQFITSKSKTISGKASTGVEGGVKFLIRAQVKGNFEGELKKTVESKPLEIDIEDVNDIIKALESIKFNKIILLEDFHYLSLETQSSFANNLKTFYDDSGFKFIILGVWIDKNRLITLNGDLASRIVSLNVDSWNLDSLKEVIKKGEELLNIKFDDELIEEIIYESFDNIYYVQEICHRICKSYNITESLEGNFINPVLGYYDENNEFVETEPESDRRFLIKKTAEVKNITREIVEQHSGRYQTFIVQFSEIDKDSDLEIAKWIIKAIINSPIQDLQEGIFISRVIDYIKHHHPKNELITEKLIRHFLKDVINFQFVKRIRPIIIDYDHGIKRINIVDREFIIWLLYQDKKGIEKFIE